MERLELPPPPDARLGGHSASSSSRPRNQLGSSMIILSWTGSAVPRAPPASPPLNRCTVETLIEKVLRTNAGAHAPGGGGVCAGFGAGEIPETKGFRLSETFGISGILNLGTKPACRLNFATIALPLDR